MAVIVNWEIQFALLETKAWTHYNFPLILEDKKRNNKYRIYRANFKYLRLSKTVSFILLLNSSWINEEKAKQHEVTNFNSVGKFEKGYWSLEALAAFVDKYHDFQHKSCRVSWQPCPAFCSWRHPHTMSKTTQESITWKNLFRTKQSDIENIFTSFTMSFPECVLARAIFPPILKTRSHAPFFPAQDNFWLLYTALILIHEFYY